VHVYSAQQHRVPRPRQLPADITSFTGRAYEVLGLNAALNHHGARRSWTVALVTVTGAAGVGKTALVVHWAHRMRDHFPDGELYVDLRGYPAGPPARTADVLERFLHALDVPAGEISDDLESRAALTV
jgi:predicted ATPase